MKKLLLTFVFIIFSLFTFSQTTPNPNVPKTNVTHNSVHNGWAKWGNSCAGCAGLYYRIDRINQPVYENDGNYYYYFYFYFYSDSYYSNGQLASTYLRGVNFYIGDTFIFNLDYLLIPPKQSYYGGWIKTTDPNALVRFTWDSISVY